MTAGALSGPVGAAAGLPASPPRDAAPAAAGPQPGAAELARMLARVRQAARRAELLPDGWADRLILIIAAEVERHRAALEVALGAATHGYVDPGGGSSGCSWLLPADLAVYDLQVCTLPPGHPLHQTPRVVRDRLDQEEHG